MPEGLVEWKERHEILTYEEILRIARVAARIGFRKFRVTGGEPLIRKDVVPFLSELARLPGIQSLGVSTNGTRLSVLAKDLHKAGVQTLNISLDALTPSVYHQITKGDVHAVVDGIHAALKAGFERIKLNTVLIRGLNEDEIWPLIHFAGEHGLILRFIELMPISTTDVLTDANFLGAGEVIRRLSQRDRLIPLETVRLGHGPARYYRLEQNAVTIGFIGVMTNLHFCEACNKVRLTADGKLRPCLGNHLEVDVREPMRHGATDEEIEHIFEQTLLDKPLEHTFRDQYQPARRMHAIGG